MIKRRVLVIEDDDFLREEYVSSLRSQGFDVHEATDGVGGIQILANAAFDAIVLDLMMPRLNGYQVIDFILHAKPALLPRVIVVSSKPDSIFRSIYCVLKKPFASSVLLSAVSQCVASAERSSTA